MKRLILNIAVPLIALTFSIILSIILVFCTNKLNEPNKMSMLDYNGREIYGVSILDLEKKNLLKYAYYTPDEFAKPQDISDSSTEVDLTKQKNIAKKGTYQFVLYSINPEDEDFYEKQASLEPYIGSDRAWHFTLYLPPCFSAATVYVNSDLKAEVGSIKDYNYIDYSDKQGISEIHREATEPLAIDLDFYSRRTSMVNTFGQRAKIITVHYESTGYKAGFNGVPAIGSAEEINSLIMDDRILLITISVFGGIVFSTLIFACFLKKSLFALPLAVLAFGVTGFCLLQSFTYFHTNTPLLVTTCIPIFACIIVVAAILSLIYAILKRRPEFLVAPPIAFAFLIDYIILPLRVPVFTNPTIWLSVLIVLFTGLFTLAFYAGLERRNVYLTNNLKSEVARQTEDLKAIINERDKLLRFLSHDMKKPLSSIKNFVGEIRKNETNEENNKALDIIDSKLDALQSDFVELQKFAKMNFSAEASETIYTDELLGDIYTRLSPDCEANGIMLRCFSPNIAVYGKTKMLTSVLDNLVFNAIEHAKCKNITISAIKSYGVCKICVIDDGIGIQGVKEAFLPYHSQNTETENLGLGLFICKQHMMSMGGNLIYERENDKSIFTVTLSLA